MNDLTVTTLFISLYAISLVPITGWVGVLRGQLGAFRGNGDNPVLEKRIRIHRNYTENAPAMALVLGASELQGAPSWALWSAVVCFVLGRITHFILFDSKARAGAMSLTQFPAAALGIWCVYNLIAG